MVIIRTARSATASPAYLKDPEQTFSRTEECTDRRNLLARAFDTRQPEAAYRPQRPKFVIRREMRSALKPIHSSRNNCPSPDQDSEFRSRAASP